MIDVSVIIASWNTAERLVRTIDAVSAASDGLTVELIVVDNASTDGTRTLLAEKFPDVQTVLHDENLGFARACNAGARLAAGRALLFLNSDCEVASGALRTMLAALAASPDVGAVLPRLSNADGTLQPSVHERFPTPWHLLGEMCFLSSMRYALYRHRGLAPWLLRGQRARHARSGDVAWGGGACVLVRREAWEAVGGFDERYFMYWEDVDFCQRLGAAGWRIRFVHDATAMHHWGSSAAQRPPKALIAPWTSRLRYFAKHFPEWGAGVASAVLTLDLAVRRAVYGALAVLPARRAWGRARVAEARAAAHAVGKDAIALGAGNTGATLFFLLVVGFAGVRFAHDLLKIVLMSDFIDFAHYYTFARLVAEGANPFDPAAIAAMDARLRLPRASGGADYPPLFYFLVQPWTSLPFRVGAVAWIATLVVSLGATAAMMVRALPTAPPARIAAAVFVGLAYQPLYEELAVGQVNVVLLALITAAWWQAGQGRPWLAGAALGLVVHIKPQYGLLVPLLALAGRWDVAVRAVVAGAAGFIVGVAALGIDHYVSWVHEMSSTAFGDVFAWNISASAIVRRLARLADAPGVVSVVTWTINVCVLALVGRAMLRRSPNAADWQWGLALTSVILVSPMLEEHHFVLLLLPLALVLLRAAPARAAGIGDAALILVAVLLLASRYSVVRFDAAQSTGLALLLAGKWLGAAVLALALERRIRAA